MKPIPTDPSPRMLTLIEERKLRSETRSLRQRIAQVTNAWTTQKENNRQLRDQLELLEQAKQQLEERNRSLQNENQSLKDEIASLTVHKNKLAGMLFKTSHKPPPLGTKKRGAQLGHPGVGRKVPERIDQEKTVFLSHCPTCDTALERSTTVYQRTVEDLPPQHTVVTRYSIERQWCGHCRKEVCAVPKDTLPGLRFGLNLVTLMIFQKYRLRLPLNKIREALRIQHGFSVREGGIQRILHSVKEILSPEYEKIKQFIRSAPTKHADETSWNIEGKKGWSWLFATEKEALYTMEACRGKGVPQKILGENPTGVLVRDDYGGYRSLPMEQQSCWTHLLRVSREATKPENASTEVKALHTELKELFGQLKAVVDQPFEKEVREKAYADFLEQVRGIQRREYLSKDAQAVQTRIKNQDKNLLTALRHASVPLTNNHAERQIRPLAVMRKISGGSRSSKGAATHAVNLSVVQTLVLRQQAVFEGLRELLVLPGHRYCLGNGE